MKKYFLTLFYFLSFNYIICADLHIIILQNEKNNQIEKIKNTFQSYAISLPNITVISSDMLHNQVTKLNSILRNSKQDIFLILNEHILPAQYGYDQLIINEIKTHFPNFDGILNLSPKLNEEHINYVPVIGKNYLSLKDATKNLFPNYQNPFYLFKELTLVSRILCKEKIIDKQILSLQKKLIIKENENDACMFRSRQKKMFDIQENNINKNEKYIWSILICTLEERKKLKEKLHAKLLYQIIQENLEGKVEILFYSDNRERPTGAKRNALLRQARGKYICFIDDDDDISDTYIQTIYEKLQKNPDCVELKGIITWFGKNPQLFIHSKKYLQWYKKNEIYYRCPNHLNPLRRSIAVQVSYPEIKQYEDRKWAFKLLETQLIKAEESVDKPYYFYRYGHA